MSSPAEGGYEAGPRDLGRLGIVVAAAGYGTRLGGPGPKQYVDICGEPMLRLTLRALSECSAVSVLVVVVNPEDVEYCENEIVSPAESKVRSVVGGGAERALSVREGLRALGRDGFPELIGVHDGARPFVRCGDIGAALGRLDADPGLDGVALGVKAVDTVKIVDEGGRISSTPDRRRVWQVQTPQIFRGPILRSAYGQDEEVLRSATDDAALVEAVGGQVAVVEGSVRNFKVTSPEDLRVAELLAREEQLS